jgi:hypothetical protein
VVTKPLCERLAACGVATAAFGVAAWALWPSEAAATAARPKPAVITPRREAWFDWLMDQPSFSNRDNCYRGNK